MALLFGLVWYVFIIFRSRHSLPPRVELRRPGFVLSVDEKREKKIVIWQLTIKTPK